MTNRLVRFSNGTMARRLRLHALEGRGKRRSLHEVNFENPEGGQKAPGHLGLMTGEIRGCQEIRPERTRNDGTALDESQPPQQVQDRGRPATTRRSHFFGLLAAAMQFRTQSGPASTLSWSVIAFASNAAFQRYLLAPQQTPSVWKGDQKSFQRQPRA